MTSSLVGSEMCIRDRHRDGGSFNGEGDTYPHDVCASEVAPSNSHRGLPVSYTHLTLPTICSV
eukprot:2901486-Prorocentrum_lima.AAC.1